MSEEWLIDFGKVSALTRTKISNLLSNMGEDDALIFFAKHGRMLHVRKDGNTFYLTYNKLFTHKRDLEDAISDVCEWIKNVKPCEWELVRNP